MDALLESRRAEMMAAAAATATDNTSVVPMVQPRAGLTVPAKVYSKSKLVECWTGVQ